MLCLIAPAVGQVTSTPSSDQQSLVDEVRGLKKELQELKAQISAMQQAQKASVETVSPAPQIQVTQDTPKAGAEPPPVEEEKKSTLDLYGFVMLDAGYDFKTNNPDWFDVVRPTKLASFSPFAP